MIAQITISLLVYLQVKYPFHVVTIQFVYRTPSTY